MAASTTHSEPAKMEQIITEFFAKSLHIILESRCPCASARNLTSPSSSSSSSSSFRPRDKWFNLALLDYPAALENIDFWHQSNREPLVIDVLLLQNSSSETDEFGYKAKSENIFERWVVHYQSRKNCRDKDKDRDRDSGSGNKRLSSSSSSTSHQVLYKKAILLLRSLYLTLRLLPAYKLFRCLNSSSQIPTFNLTHRVSSFVEPFTRREEVDMQRYAFTPVDTSSGRLCISVLYRSSVLVSDVSSLETSTTPMSPRFIPDYVGSPLADPLKRLPSLPMPPPTQSSPPPFGRRHSWSYDLTRASPYSAFPSPSSPTTYSEPHVYLSKPFSTRPPPTTLPCHPPQVPYPNTSFDDYWPSPSFSPSSSPSPPTPHVPRTHLSKALLRSDSAPVNIPASRLGDAPLLSKKHVLPPPPSHKATSSGSRFETSSTILQTGSTIDKLFSLGKDETRRLSGAKITSNSSPPKSFSRSSSRLSLDDSYDDSEFSGPFVVDDDDMTDPDSRGGCSYEKKDEGGVVRKRQDGGGAGAVGALVRMLKKAPPLCQQQRDDDDVSSPSMSKITTNNRSRSTTTTANDALEQLKGYKQIKHNLLLLNQSHSQAHSPSFF